MKLEEAKERLLCLYSENADLLSNAFEFEEETIYIDEELANEYLLENEAIDTLLQEIEHLQKENEELKEVNKLVEKFPVDEMSNDTKLILITKGNFLTNPCFKNLLDNYISKDKIKDCLEDIEDYFENVSVPKEDIEFIKEKRKDLLKEE
jgi:hypothetical protein